MYPVRCFHVINTDFVVCVSFLECVWTHFPFVARQWYCSGFTLVGPGYCALLCCHGFNQTASLGLCPIYKHHFLVGFGSKKRGRQCLGNGEAQLGLVSQQGPRGQKHTCRKRPRFLVKHWPHLVLTAGFSHPESW